MDENDNGHQNAIRLAVLETRLNGTIENIVLQAREYERRLGELNHAHQQATERNAEYLPREIFDGKLSEWEIWRRLVDSRSAEHVTMRAWEVKQSEWDTWRRSVDSRHTEHVSLRTWEEKQSEWDAWRRQIDQWRWISIGAAAAAGGVAGYLAKIFGG